MPGIDERVTEEDIALLVTRLTPAVAERLATPAWMDLDAACQYTSLSESTLRRASDAGLIRISKVGRRRLLHRPDIDRWLSDLSVGTGTRFGTRTLL
jgi:excisionase family DNA binding protein